MAVLVARGKVGSKGELFPPKEVREAVGLFAHRQVEFRVEGGELVVRPILSIDDLLRRKGPKVKVTLEELREIRRTLSREAERM